MEYKDIQERERGTSIFMLSVNTQHMLQKEQWPSGHTDDQLTCWTVMEFKNSSIFCAIIGKCVYGRLLNEEKRECSFFLPFFIWPSLHTSFQPLYGFCVHTLLYFLEARQIFNEKLMNIHIKLDLFFN